MRKHLIIISIFVCVFGLTTSVLQSADFPTKPIEIIVTYAPGGSTDTTARIVSPMASEILGQPLVIINKPGAGGALALNSVAKSKSDGYTLVIFAINAPILNAMNPDAGFHSVNDFTPICNFIKQANILVVPSGSKITTMAQYVEMAKKNPGKVTAGSSGVGSSQHFSIEMFKKVANLDLTHVPHKGSSPCVIALLGEHLDSGFINAPDVMQHIMAGKLRALAVSTARRIPELPEVPTVAESGYPGFEVISWVGLAAPAGTPAPVVDKLADVFRQSMQNTEVVKKLKSVGFIPAYMPPKEFGVWIKSEYEKYTKLAKEADIKLQ